MDPEEKELADALDERFNELPKIVQDAITSADIEKRLRTLADQHNLHIDQWDKLENEVQLTLMGFQENAELASNIQANVGVSAEIASSLAQDISKIVFEPIREALDRGLGSPQAKEEEVSDIEKVRNQVLKEAGVRPAGDLPAQKDPTLPPTLAEQVAVLETTAPPSTSGPAQPVQPTVAPGTPPASPPVQKVERAPASESYHAQNPSTDRKTVDGDPYREQLK